MYENILTEKFMSNTVSVRRFVDLSQKNITAWNLLLIILQGRCEAYPTRQAYATASSHAYGMQSMWGLTGYGEKLLIEYRASWLNGKYIETEGYDQEIVNLLDQALFHPCLTESALNEAKYLLKNRLISLYQDPDALAVQECLRQIAPGKSISIPMQGIAQDIEQVSLDQIHHCWQTLLETPAMVLSCGKMEDAIDQFLTTHIESQPITSKWHAIDREEVASKTLEKEISQSSLCQIYTTGVLPQDPQYYALLVLNAALGQSSTSLLFEVIREQHSYCYSISSSLIRFDGALLINTAADRSNLEDVRRLITQCIEEIASGRMDPSLLKLAKYDLLDGLGAQQDSARSMMEQQFLNTLLSREISIEEIQDRIEAVTMEEVAALAGKLKLISEVIVEQKETEGLE